uniref:Uncharacterized protein n=1 Tax=Methylophaga nitratireducenticrescens TaxID=754476 RepID=I1XER8_METNJ
MSRVLIATSAIEFGKIDSSEKYLCCDQPFQDLNQACLYAD